MHTHAMKRPSQDPSGRPKRRHIKVEIDSDESVPVKLEDCGIKLEIEPLVVENDTSTLPNEDVIVNPTVKVETSVKLERLESAEIKQEVKQELLDEIADLPNFFDEATETTAAAPKKWRDIYNEIVWMRRRFMAPVDTQGCERMPNTINPNIKQRNPQIFRFQLLVSLMLSSQTKDEVNFQAMTNLHQGLLGRGFEDGLALGPMLLLSEAEIDAYICKVGFHNRKAVYIKNACVLLRDNFNGDIPKTIEDIVSLPGVGPKMGYLLLQNGWNINSGIGVDVHLHRLAQMWGWTSKKAKTPEHTRLELQQWLPRTYWGDINPLLVGFGQAVCVPRASNCDICTLSRKGLCSGSNKKLKLPLSQERLVKLSKQRADLSQLIADVI